MFGLIEKLFIVLLSFNESSASIVNVPNQTKCIILNNQPCMPQSTLFNLNPDEYK